MRFLAGALLAGALAGSVLAAPVRPPITGISHIAVYTADAAASEDYYVRILGARKAPDPEGAHGVRYYFSARQFVEVLPVGPNPGLSRLAHVGWNTPDAAALRSYLLAHKYPGVSPLRHVADGSLWFITQDPEGNEVQFVQPASTEAKAEPGGISGRIIHVGYMVRNREAEDRFYRNLLGFRPYWHGAMKPDATDWISQQVPDGHDWLEYMMVGPGSTTPLNKVDARQLGVLNHFSLGVKNMEAAVTTLIAGNRLSPRHDGPSMGRDGKWQANLYDPDGTRAELMEFKPVTKPCCSDFTAESPSE